MRRFAAAVLPVALLLVSPNVAQARGGAGAAAHPGARVVVDAHNCYPEQRAFRDRIDDALAAGTPIAIEQDLAWYTNPRTRRSRPVLSHSAAGAAGDPGLERYFFERVRPLVERALRANNRAQWPLITLNLDLKSEQPAELAAIWALLKRHRKWLTTALRTADLKQVEPLAVGPILVLTGSSARQRRTFYDAVPVGGRLLVFGAVRHGRDEAADNYHRWINYSWSAVEPGGAVAAGAWSPSKQRRLDHLAASAHRAGLWIRFYTLDGASVAGDYCHGWSPEYNFGSLAAAQLRWRAAAKAGVDYIATDQPGALAATLAGVPVPRLNAETRGSCSSAPLADHALIGLLRLRAWMH